MADRTSSPTLTAVPLVAAHDGLWSLRSGALERRLDVDVTAVALDGPDVLVLEGHRRITRVTADGAVEPVATLAGDVHGTTLAPHHDAIWVGTDPAALWRVAAGDVARVTAFESAPTSDEWHTPWGGPPAVFSFATSGDDLYVGVHVGGILRSSNGGATWASTIDLHDDVHQVAVDDTGRVWAATGGRGLASSDDRGASWTYHRRGLHATYALAVAPVRGGALVAVSSGHAAKDGALYRLDGDELVRCTDGLPRDLRGAIGPRKLAARGERAAVALPDGTVCVSEDGGRTWDDVARLGGITEVVLAPG